MLNNSALLASVSCRVPLSVPISFGLVPYDAQPSEAGIYGWREESRVASLGCLRNTVVSSRITTSAICKPEHKADGDGCVKSLCTECAIRAGIGPAQINQQTSWSVDFESVRFRGYKFTINNMSPPLSTARLERGAVLFSGH